MSVYVLHAGDGYTYFTRQRASGYHRRRHGEALTAYGTAGGNPVVRWIRTGLAAMDVEGQISHPQMKTLFFEGLDRDADARIQEAFGRGAGYEAANPVRRAAEQVGKVEACLSR